MFERGRMLICCVVVLAVAGCASTSKFTQFDVKNVDFETTWLAAIEAVSDLGNISEANKQEGRIVAFKEKKWQRAKITVRISQTDGSCKVEVQVEKQEKSKYLRAGGFLVEESWESTGRDTLLELNVKDRINAAIKRMIKKSS